LHQEYLKILFTHRIEIIFFDDCNLLIDLKKESIENFSKLKDYYLYICHIFNSHNEFSPKDYILLNYYDFFQTPLQPLRDNLQSQTYECFEEDSIKYELYQNAIEKALTNFKTKGRLSINNLSNKMIIEDDYCKSLHNNNRILHAYVLGAGRGPLARRLINAALNLGFVIGKDIKITCVEKNRNAFNTLQYLQLCEPELFSKVQMVFSDMRDFKPEEKADIVISELLGSFGDNELSPECLIKIQNYLSEDSVMIPNSYTSFIRPVTCPVVWSAVNL
jgi:protein arginine N-methyltransferase 5